MQTLLKYLFETGVLEHGTKEEIEEAKKEYRRKYSKEKQKEFREKNVRKEIILTRKEFSVLCKAAKKHKIKLAPFIKQAALAQVAEKYLLPSDSVVQELELAIRRIGNNVNQLVRYAHQNNYLPKETIAEIQNQLNELEGKISKAFREPLKVHHLVEFAIKKHPELVEQLENLLSKYKQK
ncbi:MAG: hypothetical protein COB85_09675 [Bacteroidetes bacterium]|nr:MAG: hypothetical protein COB85_09675 [Bacteroidota bacterium]